MQAMLWNLTTRGPEAEELGLEASLGPIVRHYQKSKTRDKHLTFLFESFILSKFEMIEL